MKSQPNPSTTTEDTVASPATESTNPANPAETAPEAIDILQGQIAELTNDLQRTRADFENFRKQVESQKAAVASGAKDDTVVKFLPMVDDFARALATYPEQLNPLAKNFHKTLSSLGLEIIDSAPNTEFDPDLHEAVSVEDGEGETEVIAETLRPGYKYDGGIIRPAMVKVKRI